MDKRGRFMAKAKKGDIVKVHYTGKYDDGEVFDSSLGRVPLKFTLGTNQVIQGFEEGILGMEKGEKKNIKIPMEKAYGSPNKDKLFKINRDQIPSRMNPRVGEHFEITKDENTFFGLVKELGPDYIIVDTNHPMAGKDLNFEIELVEIL